jgi:hypothetical protein
MHERYLDAMVLARTFGVPSLFITFTCNPAWPEITRALSAHDAPSDGADLIVRVFHMKNKHLIKRVTKDAILGNGLAYNYAVEFQSRGLPHIHLLLYLKE